MFQRTRFLASRTMVAAAAMVLVACGDSASERTQTSAPAGAPVEGGEGTVLIVSEPRSLDPAAIGNTATSSGVVANALYGTLLTNDVVTGEVQPSMAESFTSTDGGATFDLFLRSGLVFSDGTPLDSSAVKANWDRIRDPATGSVSIRDASLVESTEIVDQRTLRVVLREPVPRFAQSIVTSGLNWVASPAALELGQQAFDQNPIGAGPFTLASWTRQAQIEMVRNPTYWDSPKPYLDSITFRPITDTNQRTNTLRSGAADIAVLTSGLTANDMRESGMAVEIVPQGGGQAIFLNTRRAPFDDLRARRAVAAAIDLDAINLAVNNGHGEVPRTLFRESSPFFSDTQLSDYDPDTARRLFRELAAEGNPVSFTYTAYNTIESSGVAEAVQAALSAYEDVTVQVRTIDVSEVASLYTTNDYDAIVSSVQVVDPEPQLWTAFHGDSSANRAGIDDPQLNELLDSGRVNEDPAARKADYEAVQERLTQLVPAIFYTRTAFGSAATTGTYGVRHYGFGSLLPGELWIE